MEDFRAEEDLGRVVAPKDSRLLIIAVIVSLAIHGTLAAVLMNGRIESNIAAPVQSVSVTLVEANPLRSPIIEEEPPAAVNTENPEQETVEPESVMAEEQQIEELLEETLIAEESAAAESLESNIEPVTPIPVRNLSIDVPQLPSLDAVARSVQNLNDNQSSRFYSYDCNPLEEEAGIRECEPSQQTNFQFLEQNSTYRELNPTRQLTRSQRSLNVVSSSSRDLAGRLRDSDLPEGLSDYLIEELEAGISHNVNVGNRATQHIIDMTDKSSAAAQAKQILGDGWVIKKSKELQDRQVHLPN